MAETEAGPGGTDAGPGGTEAGPGGTDAGPGGTEQSRRAARRVRGRFHISYILILAVLTAALAGVGWNLRPQSTGFPQVPAITIHLPSTGALVAHEILARTPGNGAMLTVYDSPAGPDVVPGTPQAKAAAKFARSRWAVVIQDLGTGRLCSPQPRLNGAQVFATSPQRLVHAPFGHVLSRWVGDSNSNEPGTSAILGKGQVLFQICWPSGGPVSLSGAYLSAQFPRLWADGQKWPADGGPPPGGNLGVNAGLSLDASAGSAANFVVQSLPTPGGASNVGWSWPQASTSDFEGFTASPVHLSAVDVSETQRETYRGFLSGVALGIAGGSLIALVGELVLPFSRRRDVPGENG